VLRQVAEQEPVPIRRLNPDVPVWLEEFIRRLLAKDPAERFQSASEVSSLLESYLAHLRQPVTVPLPALPPVPGVLALDSVHAETPRGALWKVHLSLALALVVFLAVIGVGIARWAQGNAGVEPKEAALGDGKAIASEWLVAAQLVGLAVSLGLAWLSGWLY